MNRNTIYIILRGDKLKKLVTIPLLLGILLLAGCSSDSDQTANTNSEEVERKKNQSEQNDDLSNDSQNQEQENDDSSNTNKSNNDEERNSDSGDEQNESEQAADTLNKEEAKVVLTDYEKAFKYVINNTNQELKQQEFTNQQQLKEYFQNYMSEDLAISFMETFIRVEEDGLYIVATEGPLFLDTEQPFTFTEIDGDTASVTQERENTMSGHIQIEYTLTNNEDLWIVDDINSEQLK